MGVQTSTSTVSLEVVSVARLLADSGSPIPGGHLHADAAQRILALAERLPTEGDIRIEIGVPAADLNQVAAVRETVARHFTEEQELAREELRVIFWRGRVSTITGLLATTALLATSQFIAGLSERPLITAVSESMIIFGWVAMWKPAELLLYNHWPVRRRRNLAGRLAAAELSLRAHGQAHRAISPG